MSDHSPPWWAIPFIIPVALFMQLPAALRWGLAAAALLGAGWVLGR